MTTNKPEVVAWSWDYRGQLMLTTVYSRALGLAEPPYPTEVEPLIRLSDYEARMAVLFDGHAVYSAMTDKAKQHTSPESVAVVLDAVAKLMGEVRHG